MDNPAAGDAATDDDDYLVLMIVLISLHVHSFHLYINFCEADTTNKFLLFFLLRYEQLYMIRLSAHIIVIATHLFYLLFLFVATPSASLCFTLS
jgi:hypothetical protein